MGKQWKFLTRAFSELPCSLELFLPIPFSSLAPVLDPDWHLGLYALLTSPASSHLCPSWAFLTTVAVYSQAVSNSVTPWTAAHQASLPFAVSWSLLKLVSIKVVTPSNRLILSSPSSPALNLSQHQDLFQWVSSFFYRWPKYWRFSFYQFS